MRWYQNALRLHFIHSMTFQHFPPNPPVKFRQNFLIPPGANTSVILGLCNISMQNVHWYPCVGTKTRTQKCQQIGTNKIKDIQI